MTQPIEYKHVSFNVAFVSFLVKQINIPVVSLDPFPQYRSIRRYDRFKDKAGLTGRRHQEDLAQAQGCAPSRKYQRDGGASIAQAANLVRRVSTFSARVIEFLIKWQIMNPPVVNSDGHAKSLSLDWEDETLGLLPFYDLVSTGVYGGTTKELAFGFGGTREVGQKRNAYSNQFAKDMGVSAKLVNCELQGIISVMKNQGRKSLEEFQHIYGLI
jgi:serine/threonine-protein kinase HipA